VKRRLVRVRTDHGLTRLQFAQRIGVDSSYVSKIESGEKHPNNRLIKLVCLQFGLIEGSPLTEAGPKYKRVSYKTGK
jgi:transcriptional regulator with XRE-family HTH domain